MNKLISTKIKIYYNLLNYLYISWCIIYIFSLLKLKLITKSLNLLMWDVSSKVQGKVTYSKKGCLVEYSYI